MRAVRRRGWILVAVLLAVGVNFGCAEKTCRNLSAAYLDDMSDWRARLDDAVTVASLAARSDLGQHVAILQELKREVNGFDVPDCREARRLQGDAEQLATVTEATFVLFAAGASDEEVAQAMDIIDAAQDDYRDSYRLLAEGPR